jgi:hypothetical protein
MAQLLEVSADAVLRGRFFAVAPGDKLPEHDFQRSGRRDAEQCAHDAGHLCAGRDAHCDRERRQLHRPVIDDLLKRVVLDLLIERHRGNDNRGRRDTTRQQCDRRDEYSRSGRADERDQVEDRGDESQGNRVRDGKGEKDDGCHRSRYDADHEVSCNVPAYRCRDTAADATDTGATLLRSETHERLEPLAAAKLDEQGQECDEDGRAARLNGGADQVQRRPRRRTELSRVHRSSCPFDDLEAILEKTEPSIPARQILEQLRKVVDEPTRLVYERCEQQVCKSDEREHEECETDADGSAAAQTTALERLDERLGRHCEHHRDCQLSQDDSRGVHQRKEQERADRDDDEQDDRSRRYSDEGWRLAYTSGTRSAFRSDVRIRCGRHAYAPIIGLSEVTVAVAGGDPGNRASPCVVARVPSCWTGRRGRVAAGR